MIFEIKFGLNFLNLKRGVGIQPPTLLNQNINLKMLRNEILQGRNL